jgi:DNA-binding GntR family transcriptional regulator
MRRWRAPHLAYHNLLVSGAGPRVSEEIEQLFDHAERYRLRWGTEGVWTQRKAEHRAIIDAAAARDQDLAALRLAEHYAGTAALIFTGLDPDHNLLRLRETMRTVAPGSERKLKVR